MAEKGLGKGLKEINAANQQHKLPFLKRQEPLDKRFQEYHAANPHVFDLLVQFTRELKSAGIINFGVGALFERIRWHVNVETHDPEGFKMNNSYRSRYARLIEEKHPDLAGIYRMRKLRS